MTALATIVDRFIFTFALVFYHWSKMVLKWQPMITIFSGHNSEVLRHLLAKFHISSTFLNKPVLASLPLMIFYIIRKKIENVYSDKKELSK